MKTLMKRTRFAFALIFLVSILLLLLRIFVSIGLPLGIGLVLFLVSSLGIWISSAFTGEEVVQYARHEDGALKNPTGDRAQLPLGAYNHTDQ